MRVPRRLSMTRREEFAAVRTRGRSMASRNLVMATLSDSSLDHLKFGFITSRKSSRRAVMRNLIRRRLRAILVKHGEKIDPGRYLVVVARQKASKASFGELEADWLRLGQGLGIFGEENMEEKEIAHPL
ncbi:MAG TPA: ribonuclease P protein component [Verrucomicrobiales bacterium]|nr:ribonuclease P protein component [Verrucomicrobiales bacterium]